MKNRAALLVRLPGLFACLAVILLVFCGQANDHEQIRKKSMPDLHYAYVDSGSATRGIDESIASTMEFYALDPQVFGDPVGIIATFSDSLSLSPSGRQAALILTDASWEPPAGIHRGTISGGDALVYDCYRQYDSLDACWREIADFAREHGHICVGPGIEIYKAFGAESAADSSLTQLIIRIN